MSSSDRPPGVPDPDSPVDPDDTPTYPGAQRLPEPAPSFSGAYPPPQPALPPFAASSGSGAFQPPIIPGSQPFPPPSGSGAFPPPMMSGSQPLPMPSGSLPTSPGLPSGALPPGAYMPASQPWQIPSGPPPPIPGKARQTRVGPLPFWLRALGAALIVVTLLAIFIVRQTQGNDWADGVLYVAYGAAILAGLVLLATTARLLAGMAAKTNPLRRRQLASASILLGLLLLLAGEGITLQSPVHHLQALSLEGQQQWDRALAEFRLAGQRPPDSRDLARTYDEWGEQFSGIHQYQAAIEKFDLVLHSYGLATNEVQQAQTDEIDAYLNWGKQAAKIGDYASATAHYDALLMLTFCNGACRSNASALDATAYYHLAEASLAASDYSTAVNAFQMLQSRFADAPEAQQIHADFARALLGLGKQQRIQSPCPEAIATYQKLIQNFADTPEGQQAQLDYNAPEPVTGDFTGSVAYFDGGEDLVFLLQGVVPGESDAYLLNLVNAAIRAGRVTTIDVSVYPATFTFKPVPQGTYVLTWAVLDNTGSGLLRRPTSDYVANVGPLCSDNTGSITEDVIPFS